MTSPVGTGPQSGAISLWGYEPVLEGSVEVARLWVKPAGPATFLLDTKRLASPEMFGMLITDCVRTAATAYAKALSISEGEALSRIWEGLDAERGKPTTETTVIEPDGRSR